MSKKLTQSVYEHERGQIQDNHLKALVTDKLFRIRVEKNQKGKGSYTRKNKHRRQDEYNLKIAA